MTLKVREGDDRFDGWIGSNHLFTGQHMHGSRGSRGLEKRRLSYRPTVSPWSIYSSRTERELNVYTFQNNQITQNQFSTDIF